MMRYIALTLALLFAVAVQADAGDRISASSLSAVGLSGMQPMSDAQGMQVRAKGFVYGESTATSFNAFFIGPVVGGGFATSTNGYVNWNFGNTFGANLSGADSGTFGPTAFSGGFSFTN